MHDFYVYKPVKISVKKFLWMVQLLTTLLLKTLSRLFSRSVTCLMTPTTTDLSRLQRGKQRCWWGDDYSSTQKFTWNILYINVEFKIVFNVFLDETKWGIRLKHLYILFSSPQILWVINNCWFFRESIFLFNLISSYSYYWY